jgi:UTP:GlnB (protein PII) uridylyltransferase
VAGENTLTVAKFKELCSLPDQDGQPNQGLERELATLHKARQVVTQALSTIIAPSAEDSQSTERDDLRGITDQIETEISPGATSEQVLGLCLEHVANLQSRLKEGEELSPDALEANCRTMRQTVAQIEAEVKLNEGHLEIFRRILSEPGYAGVAIQLMCEAGLIDRFFPDFKDLQFRPEIGRYEALPQIEQDHVYLLGQHAIQACLNLDKLLRENTAGIKLDSTAIAPLYLALFRHEAGKLLETRHGEHCSIGAKRIREDCGRLGFSETETALSARLVEQQSLMVDFVDTRICSNSSVIHEFSEAVKDESFLDLLYLFTVADGNPKHDQVQAVLQHDGIKALVESARRKINEPNSTSTAPVTSLPEGSLPSDELIGLLNRFNIQDDLTKPLICWQPPKTGMPLHMRELLLVAQDRPGLFAEISTILCVEGLSIRQADLSCVDGIACDRVIVENPQGTPLDNTRLERISRLLANPDVSIEDCAEALARYLQGKRTACFDRIDVVSHNPTIEIRLVEGASGSEAKSIEITIQTQDHVGVAAIICVALAQVGASITSAKFGNRGRRVLNVLQVEFNEQSSTTGVSDRAALLSAQMTSELKKVQA